MISARMALLRQAQEYFHLRLLGVVKWDDVHVDKAIPIAPVKGSRDQGKVRDLVVAHFDGFRMELGGPFDSDEWPLGRVRVEHGGVHCEGPLDAATWDAVADFIKHEKQQGADNGSVARGEDWGR